MDQQLLLLKASIAAADRPVSIGYFEHGPQAGQLLVEMCATYFGRTMPKRYVNQGSPVTLLNTAQVWERINSGQTPESVIEEARRRMPAWTAY
jgi:hypothetical protein